MIVHLKIKIKSLAAEASIIRKEANKTWTNKKSGESGFIYDSDARFSLHSHRRFDVRSEARSAQLAYGYLRGRAYKQLEFKCHEAPNWSRVADLIRKYGLKAVEKKQLLILLEAWAAQEFKREAA